MSAGGMSSQEPGAASNSPPGLEPIAPVDSTSAALSTAGNPNPFWSERMQEEFRLQAARPGFLNDETADELAGERVEVDACRVPILDDTSVDEEHVPYDFEQLGSGEVPSRHAAGGDMLRRTTNAAFQETGDQSALLAASDASRHLAQSAQVNSSGVDAVQRSPDRYSISTAGLNPMTRQLQDLRLDQPEGQVYGLRVGAAPAAVNLSRLASGDAESLDGQEQDLSGAFPQCAATVGQPQSANNAGVGLPHAEAGGRTAVLQMVQTGGITGDASAIL